MESNSEARSAGSASDPAASVMILEQREPLVEKIVTRLQSFGEYRIGRLGKGRYSAAGAELTDWVNRYPHTTVIFSPLKSNEQRSTVDIEDAQAVLELCGRLGVSRLVLISSAEIYGSDYAYPGLMSERKAGPLKRPNQVAAQWEELESCAAETLAPYSTQRVTLRPCWTPWRQGTDFASRYLRRRLVWVPAGYNPNIQLLSLDDLASAIVSVVRQPVQGVYHVAPDGAVPLTDIVTAARKRRVPVPRPLLRAVCRLAGRFGSRASADFLEFLRYPWTISSQKLKQECGFQPTHSTVGLLQELNDPTMSEAEAKVLPASSDNCRSHDPFGMDAPYIRGCGNWQLGFMHKCYWRIEAEGLEHIPASGAGVLTGLHRGFMPFDGVMMVDLLQKKTGRIPRFLMHPALSKFPWLSPFLTRMGGIMACRENADYVIEQNELLGVFPEGIRGAFRMYDRGETYRLGKFRDDYVKIALHHRVPIVPFVTVGPAEAFPILAKVEWRWWKQYTHWPFFPITATWPWLPFPLPTKWHFKVLPPIETHHFPVDAAEDRRVVRQLSQQVRQAMQEAIDQMRRQRRSIFYGSIFNRLGQPPTVSSESVHDEKGSDISPTQPREVA